DREVIVRIDCRLSDRAAPGAALDQCRERCRTWRVAEREHLLDAGTSGGGLCRWQQRRRAYQEARARIAELMRELGDAVERIDRSDDAAGLDDAVEDRCELRAVRTEDRA